MVKKISLITILIFLLIPVSTSTVVKTNKDNKDTIKEVILKKEALGYISFPSFNIKKEIIEGTTLDLLDKNLVGHVKESSINFNETIILAGHNNHEVFGHLKNIHKGDIIDLNIKNISKKYTVLYNFEIDENDYTYFKKQDKTLILITCTKDPKKRRIVIAKLVV